MSYIIEHLVGSGKIVTKDQVNLAITSKEFMQHPFFKGVLDKAQFFKGAFKAMEQATTGMYGKWDAFSAKTLLHTLGDFYHFSAFTALHKNPRLSLEGEHTASGLAPSKIRRFIGSVRRSTPYPESEAWDFTDVSSEHVAGRATQLVGRAFQANPTAVANYLRLAFLSGRESLRKVDEHLSKTVESWNANQKTQPMRVLVWARNAVKPDTKARPGAVDTRYRNSGTFLTAALVQCVRRAGLVPVLVGDTLPSGGQFKKVHSRMSEESHHLGQFFKQDCFGGEETVRRQLYFLNGLQCRGGVIAQVGVKAGGMDGPALMGLPTIVIDLETDPELQIRMSRWGQKLPHYHVIHVTPLVPPEALGVKKSANNTNQKPKKGNTKRQEEETPELIPVPKLAQAERESLGTWREQGNEPDYDPMAKYVEKSDPRDEDSDVIRIMRVNWEKQVVELLKKFKEAT
jgi:hypothetical protein